MTRSYLEWLLALPWSILDKEEIDIDKARRILDEDHFGLETIKRRIVEFLAVRKLNPEGHSPILCFVGPPGVGKTSLGQSIARALGLKFVRVSLGGVHDEAEIRGHRRTYVGAQPGRLVRALREAGVRSLERQIGAVLRYCAVTIASGQPGPIALTAQDLPGILGAPRFENEIAMRTSVPGVATGLAWTPVGGDILFVESSRVAGSGRLILTGQLGDVMKESAQAAMTLVQGHAERLGIDPLVFEKSDVHIHVPAGAVPKDGPSAGVAIFASLVSMLTQRTVLNDVAMTGEISLRGLVLPVGGIKEKTVAAARSGIKTVILPSRNRRDFEEIPASVREMLKFVWAERVEDVLAAAFDGGLVRRVAA
jgi:ATP-dependent Lon protease